MACRCMRHACTCRDCLECKQKACRCCCAQLDALASLSPDDLLHAHRAHVAALAHLELALAALDTLPTDGMFENLKNNLKNSIKDPKAALQRAKEAIAARMPESVKQRAAAVSKNAMALAKAGYKDNEPAIEAAKSKLWNSTLGKIGKAIVNSRPGQAALRGIEAGESARASAKSEHDMHQKGFDRRREEARLKLEEEARLKLEEEHRIKQAAAENTGTNKYLIAKL